MSSLWPSQPQIAPPPPAVSRYQVCTCRRLTVSSWPSSRLYSSTCSLTFRSLSKDGVSISKLINRVVTPTAESGDVSRHLLDTAAKAHRRYHEEMKVDFKGLNFYVVGILVAEASVDAS